ncbi:hypothetical protein [Pontibacter sp. G13]|uniref:hypothetical protein n=1 Tax=Pontibacter sp. G13 TaxID=3074898 RepID=UPI00288A9561|nr:hypothetical protein [Pontibacter sp. G13]WNJ16339.1 hypothetical protein RJD25_15855 [Pontibacter sp. G13]
MIYFTFSRYVSCLFCLLFLVLSGTVKGQGSTRSQDDPDTEAPVYNSLEELIVDNVYAYPLSTDKLLKLAMYTELKGKYTPKFRTLSVSFGPLGSLAFYQQNCLLKTPSGIYHLNKGESETSVAAAAMEAKLTEVFDQVALMGDRNTDPFLVDFVNERMTKKNLEGFDKLYIRYVLVNFGKYNHEEQCVEFHSDWLDPNYGKSGARRSGKKRSKLRIRLDDKILRGYYLSSGGTVFVEDVEEDIPYATGETFTQNVTAFKVFVQRLFSESVHLVMRAESDRMTGISLDGRLAQQGVPARAQGAGGSATPVQGSSSTSQKVEPLYHQRSWIPMMLTMLRGNNVNIGDPDILIYFIDQPYFADIYRQLTNSEKTKVDQYMDSHGYTAP